LYKEPEIGRTHRVCKKWLPVIIKLPTKVTIT
jgi:hypothetical protein